MYKHTFKTFDRILAYEDNRKVVHIKETYVLYSVQSTCFVKTFLICLY